MSWRHGGLWRHSGQGALGAHAGAGLSARRIPKQSSPPPRLHGSVTSKSYSQINSINSGHSHFITAGSSASCLLQGEGEGGGRRWQRAPSTARGTVQGCIQPDPHRPAGLCWPTRKAGQKTTSSAWDDLFCHAAPACFAASFLVFYCLRPGLPPSAVQHPALSPALRWL